MAPVRWDQLSNEALGNKDRAIEDYRKAYALSRDSLSYKAKMKELGVVP